MLTYTLKLSFFAALSVLLAVVANRKMYLSDVGKRIVAFWILVLPFIFIIRNEPLNMMVFFLLPLLLNYKSPSRIMTIVFFIAILGAVPDWPAYIVSLPGINYLIRLSFDKILIVVLLLPMLMTLGPQHRVSWNVTDTLVCVFVFYMVILTFREGKLTTVLRFLVDSTVIYLVPYFVFSRVVRSMSDLHYCSLGFLFLSLSLAAVMCVSQVIQIDIYSTLNPYSIFHHLKEYRAGFLRLSGPFNGVLVGFLMLVGYLSLDRVKKYEFANNIPLWIFLLICVLCVFFGGSRGALFGFIGGIAMYYYFAKFTSVLRTVVLVLSVLLVMLEFVFDLSNFLRYEDQYGTFDYRSELFKASWRYLTENLFFGSPYYLESGYFDHLVTGLGIIDIVSAYLQVALQYGMVGLFLFVSIYLSVIIPLFASLLRMRGEKTDYDKYIVMYFTLNVVMMFIIFTTSMISLFPIFMMIHIAIGRVLSTHAILQKDTV